MEADPASVIAAGVMDVSKKDTGTVFAASFRADKIGPTADTPLAPIIRSAFDAANAVAVAV